jgi:hypothetical protein
LSVAHVFSAGSARRLELAPVLASWALHDPEFDAATGVDLQITDGISYEPSLVLLRLVQQPPPPKSEVLAERVAHLGSQAPEFIGYVTRILSTRLAGNPFAERFAADLYSLLPHRDVPAKNLVLSLLNDSVRRRQSGMNVAR